jgi:hypothetical protein
LKAEHCLVTLHESFNPESVFQCMLLVHEINCILRYYRFLFCLSLCTDWINLCSVLLSETFEWPRGIGLSDWNYTRCHAIILCADLPEWWNRALN